MSVHPFREEVLMKQRLPINLNPPSTISPPVKKMKIMPDRQFAIELIRLVAALLLFIICAIFIIILAPDVGPAATCIEKGGDIHVAHTLTARS